MPSRRVVVVVLVLVAVLVTGAAPAHAAASRPAKGKRTALLIGDSVMAALNPNYTDAARKVIGASGWNVTIDAKVNRSTAQGVAVIQAHRPGIGCVDMFRSVPEGSFQ